MQEANVHEEIAAYRVKLVTKERNEPDTRAITGVELV